MPSFQTTLDAHSYLKKQGWRGSGYSLDPTDRGISKPVLYSRKSDSSGLGKKTLLVADQWWMRAYDNSLKELGSGNNSSQLKTSRSNLTSTNLYSLFVKGTGLEGTILENHQSSQTEQVPDQAMSAVNGDAAGASASHSAAPRNTEDPTKKRKRQKESAADIRKRRKIERQEKQKINIATKRQKQIEDGTFDEAGEAEKPKLRELNRRLRHFIKQCEQKGMFTTQALLEHEAMEKAAKRQLENLPPQTQPETGSFEGGGGVHADRLQMINNPPEPLPVSTRKLSYKAEKYMRESRMRQLKREERVRLEAEMYPGSHPPSAKDLLPEEVKAKRAAEKEERRRLREEKEAKRKAAEEAKAQRQAERLEAKRLRREERLKARAEAAANNASADDKKASEDDAATPVVNGIAHDPESTPADTSKEGPKVNGFHNMPTIQDSGDIEMKDAAAAEETDEFQQDVISLNAPKGKAGKRKNQQAPSEKPKRPLMPPGMTYNEYLEDLAKKGIERAAEKERQLDTIRAKSEEERTSAERRQLRQEDIRLTENARIRERAEKKGLIVSLPGVPQPAPQVQPAPGEEVAQSLSDEKLSKYKARAEEKGVSLEEYIARRGEKKAAKHQPAEEPAKNQPVEEPSDTMLFVVDTVGDSSVLAQQDKTPAGPPNGKIELPIDPLIWEGRNVKELTKPERRARLEWLRIRRECRKEKRGKPTMSAKERRKRRVEMKMAMQNKLAYDMLAKDGVKPQYVTKEQLKDMRRRAKRMMRQAKKGHEVEGLPEEIRAKVEKKKKKKPLRNNRGGRNN